LNPKYYAPAGRVPKKKKLADRVTRTANDHVTRTANIAFRGAKADSSPEE
jgi:hypothetical protein